MVSDNFRIDFRPVIVVAGLVLIVSSIFVLTSCFKTSQLSRSIASGELKFITRNSLATYFYSHEKEQGFEYELAKLFADFLGVKLTVEIAHNPTDLINKLNSSDVPVFAGASLVDDHFLQNEAKTSAHFMGVKNQVVYNKKRHKPKELNDLTKVKIKVIENSHQAYFLTELKQKNPNLVFEQENYEIADLLRELDRGEFDVSLVSSHEYTLSQFLYSNVKSAFIVEDDLNLVWITSKYGDNSILKQIDIFLEQIKQNGTLEQITERYYQHSKSMDYVGIEIFTRHLNTRLPLYKPYFKQAAAQYNLDWRLLAAIGYQESQWLPDATSKTGVRGLMMLTQNTAQDMGVKDRLDPKQSILGGAKYFSQIRTRLADEILEPNRTLIALAAYNVGLGHVRDARILAKNENLDPNEWHNVRMMLLRLKQQKWHSKTKYGYARGGEAVHYTHNVQRYYDILTWYTFQEDIHFNAI